MIQNAGNFLKYFSVGITTKLLVQSNSLHGIEIIFTICTCVAYINILSILNGLVYLQMISTSIDDIEDFMKKEEINWEHMKFVNLPSNRYSVEIKNGNFSWNCTHSKDEVIKENKTGHINNINIKFGKGELVAVIGAFGSGKTSFINSIIGEMIKKGNP
jgi:ATP-binding cassette subfamily C (CFTR/MRP) protein 1